MKQIYFLKTIFTLCILSTMFSQAQTYNIDSSSPTFCPPNSGIEATVICPNDSGPRVDFGTFIDTNDSGVELSTMSLVIYAACDGDFEVFLNGVYVAAGNTTGTACACETIASNPNITNNITVTVTPVIVAAYVIGGSNRLSVSTSNSAFGGQCFYGADVTVSTSTLGVDNFELDTIKVYPNPTSDFITITRLKNIENYRLYDLLGAEILKGRIPNDRKIDIQNLSNGFYFLKFDKGNTIKILKE